MRRILGSVGVADFRRVFCLRKCAEGPRRINEWNIDSLHHEEQLVREANEWAVHGPIFPTVNEYAERNEIQMQGDVACAF